MAGVRIEIGSESESDRIGSDQIRPYSRPMARNASADWRNAGLADGEAEPEITWKPEAAARNQQDAVAGANGGKSRIIGNRAAREQIQATLGRIDRESGRLQDGYQQIAAAFIQADVHAGVNRPLDDFLE